MKRRDPTAVLVALLIGVLFLVSYIGIWLYPTRALAQPACKPVALVLAEIIGEGSTPHVVEDPKEIARGVTFLIENGSEVLPNRDVLIFAPSVQAGDSEIYLGRDNLICGYYRANHHTGAMFWDFVKGNLGRPA